MRQNFIRNMGNREQLITWMFRILLLSFFLPPGIQTALFIAFGAVIVLLSFQTDIRITKTELFQCVALSGVFACYLAVIPFTNDSLRHDLFAMIETKAGLILLPFLSILFIKLFPGKLIHQFVWFVYGSVLVSLIVNGIILFQELNGDAQPFSQHVAYRHAFESLSGIHPSYFGMYLSFSLAILWIHPSCLPGGKRISYLLQGLLMAGLGLLTPKAAIVALIINAIYCLVFVSTVRSRQKWLLASILAGSLFFFYIALPVFNQRVNEVFHFFNHPLADFRNNSVEVRHLIVQIDMDLLRQHWLFGMGPAALNADFMQRSWAASLLSGHPLPIYNTHNEYLNQWISFGLAGILLLLASLGLQVYRAWDEHHHLYRMFLVLIIIVFFTENILSRQQGVVYYAFFTSFLFFNTRYNYEKKG